VAWRAEPLENLKAEVVPVVLRFGRQNGPFTFRSINAASQFTHVVRLDASSFGAYSPAVIKPRARGGVNADWEETMFRQPRWVCAVVVWLAGSVAVFGQGGTAALIGTATDESKAVLPGVTITATELSTDRTYQAVTDERGEYRMANISPGRYKVKADLTGFAAVVYSNVEVLVGQNATLQFSLKLGAVEETVQVTGQAPLVDTQSAAVAGNVDRRQLENMPLSGRNWLELSMLVKGITANSVTTTPGVNNQDQYNLNIDGQQVSQRIGSLAFGQVKFSRESIAEFQIVTNQYDITQGRSTGMQVQAITKAGSNTESGSAYGYFRDDKLNAADHIANRVLPYQNQQLGGSLGGPIRHDKLFYFGSIEYEREPFTALSNPPLLPTQGFAFDSKSTTHISLARGDYQLSDRSHLSVRWGAHSYLNPFFIQAGTEHPSRVTYNPIDSNNILGTWTWVHSNTRVSELRVGYSGFTFVFANLPDIECPGQGISLDAYATKSPRYTCSPIVGPPNYSFPGGLQIGPRPNQLNDFSQHNPSIRYDTNVHHGAHELKYGGEFRHVLDEGYWHNLERGQFNFAVLPPADELNQRFPASTWNNPLAWDVVGLEKYALNFVQTFDPTGYRNYIPRPEWAVWLGDTWRTNNRLTMTFGLRWDVDWGANSPSSIVDRPIIINNGLQSGNFGFISGQRDLLDLSPRVGVTYDLSGDGTTVLRAGSGLFYSTPDSGSVYSFQLSNQELQGQWNYTGQPDFMTNPRGGVTTAQMYACIASPGTCPVSLPPQPAQIRGELGGVFRNPRTWQNTVGVQKQLGSNLGIDVQLVQFKWTHDRRAYDPNLFYDPRTGYNLDPRVFGRPNPAWGQISFSDSTGWRDYLAMPMSVTRRFQKSLQTGVAYTLMFYYNDTRNISGTPNNAFDRNADYARSTEFQRHTLRAYAIYQLPWGLSISPVYFYGSGNYFDTQIAATPYGEPGIANRLNLGPPITIPGSMLDRYEGPAVVCTGCVIPRDALRGTPLHRVDFRLTKDLALRRAKLSLMAEVFNLFDHANYGDFNATVGSATFGTPRPVSNIAYAPRTGQLAVHLRF
jgi:hypothetical protein